MDDAFNQALSIDHDQRRNLHFFHHAECANGEFVRGDGAGMGVHGVAGGLFQGFGSVALEQAAQVSVANDPDAGGRRPRR